jgi:putative spermidine/putrescine transport system permease protein
VATVHEPVASVGPRRLDRRRFDWRPYALASPAVIATSLVFAASMVILLTYSFRTFSGGTLAGGHALTTWSDTLRSGYFWRLVLRTVEVGALTAGITALLGYPMAFALYRLESRPLRLVAYFAIFSPLLTSVVVRLYGWSIVLGDGGFVNNLLLRWHLVDRPVHLLYAFPGVVVGLVHVLLPFMIFPIVSSLDQLDPIFEQAAADLGATRTTTFRRVIFPLTLPGLIAGLQLVFALAISSFATPALLGGGRVELLGNRIYDSVGNLDWPGAAVAAYVLLAISLATIALFTTLLRLQPAAGPREGA